MSYKRQKTAIGQVIAVPLPRMGGYCRVVVARADITSTRADRKVLLYGFGPRCENVKDLIALRQDNLDPDSAISIIDTSGVLIGRGEWPVLGQLPTDVVERWPFPRFITYHSTFGEWQEIPCSDQQVTRQGDLERVVIPMDPITRNPVLNAPDCRPIAQYGVSSAFGVGEHLERALQGGWKWHPPFDHPSWGR